MRHTQKIFTIAAMGVVTLSLLLTSSAHAQSSISYPTGNSGGSGLSLNGSLNGNTSGTSGTTGSGTSGTTGSSGSTGISLANGYSYINSTSATTGGGSDAASTGSQTTNNSGATTSGWQSLATLLNPITWIQGAVTFILASVIIKVLAFILLLAGMLFDAAIALSINISTWLSSAGTDGSTIGSFVNFGWGTIRDTANMFFIFILLYIAINTILKRDLTKAKHMVSQMIMAAILVNFSLFFTKAIIDIGNIFALWFYNGIKAIAPPASGQTFYISSLINGAIGTLNFYTISSNENLVFINMVIGSAVRIITYCFMIAAFVQVSMLFVARTVVFIFLMIFSPIGFVGEIIPWTAEYAKQFWNELTNQTLLAPVFMLLLYMIMTFLNSSAFSQTGGFLSTFTSIDISQYVGFNGTQIFKFVIIILMIHFAVKIAKKLSGETGKMIGQAIGAVAGVGLAVATDGASLALQKTVGAAASTMSKDEALQTRATQKGMSGAFARLQLSTADKLKSASFDARGTGMFKNFTKQAGLSTQLPGGIGPDFGKNDRKKGYEGYEGLIKMRAEKDADWLKRIGVTAKPEDLERANTLTKEVVVNGQKSTQFDAVKTEGLSKQKALEDANAIKQAKQTALNKIKTEAPSMVVDASGILSKQTEEMRQKRESEAQIAFDQAAKKAEEAQLALAETQKRMAELTGKKPDDVNFEELSIEKLAKEDKKLADALLQAPKQAAYMANVANNTELRDRTDGGALGANFGAIVGGGVGAMAGPGASAVLGTIGAAVGTYVGVKTGPGVRALINKNVGNQVIKTASDAAKIPGIGKIFSDAERAIIKTVEKGGINEELYKKTLREKMGGKDKKQSDLIKELVKAADVKIEEGGEAPKPAGGEAK
jgi:hypothetical protein